MAGRQGVLLAVLACTAGLLRPAAAAPDLSLELYPSPLWPAAGKKFSVFVQVSNTGTTASKPSSLAIWADLESAPNCTALPAGAKTVKVPVLEPGDFWPSSKTFKKVPGFAAPAAGAHILTGFVDSTCENKEESTQDPNNAVNVQTFTYNSTDGPLPDLYAENVYAPGGKGAVDLDEVYALWNGTFDAIVEVKNRGSKAAKVGALAFYVFSVPFGRPTYPSYCRDASNTAIVGRRKSSVVVPPGSSRFIKVSKLTSPKGAGIPTRPLFLVAIPDADCAVGDEADYSVPFLSAYLYGADNALPTFAVTDYTVTGQRSAKKAQAKGANAGSTADFKFVIQNVGLKPGVLGVTSLLADETSLPAQANISCGTGLSGPFVASPASKRRLPVGGKAVVTFKAVKVPSKAGFASGILVIDAACGTPQATGKAPPQTPFVYVLANRTA